MSNPVLEPTAERLGGSGPLAALRRWWLATRPQFLTASLLPVAVGTAWGVRTGAWDAAAAGLAAFAVVLAHAASNVLNDVSDHRNGSDAQNAGRIHPFTGGSRFIQNGILTEAGMLRLSGALFAAAALVGLQLMLLRGWPVFAMGLAGLLLGALYSWPGAALAGLGLGELAVAVALGCLPVAGAAWLQAGQVTPATLCLSLPVAAWVAAILLVNEVPDRVADAAAGKRTLPVRWGLPATVRLYRVLQVVALIAALGWQQLGGLPAWALAGPVAIAVAGWLGAAGIAGERAALAAAVRRTLMLHGLGCAWLGTVAVLA